MGICASVNDLVLFKEEADKFANDAQMTMDAFRAAIDIAIQRAKDFEMIASSNESLCSSDISAAMNAIDENESVLEDLDDAEEEMERKASDKVKESSQYKKAKEKISDAYDSVERKIGKLEDLLNKLNQKQVILAELHSNAGLLVYDMERLRDEAEATFYNFRCGMEELSRKADDGISFIRDLMNHLWRAGGAEPSDTRVIKVDSPSILVDIALSLEKIRGLISENADELNSGMGATSAILTDAATSAAIDNLSSMLKEFDDLTEDYENRANEFRQAADRLCQYESL